MRFPRLARGLLLRGIAAWALGCVLACAFISCAVNKTDLARRVELKNVDLKNVPDGVYEGSYTITPPPPAMAANKSVHVRVTVTGGRYASIEILEPPRIRESAAFKTLISRVQESQSLSMDAVSGATITSTAVLKAIQKAVGP